MYGPSSSSAAYPRWSFRTTCATVSVGPAATILTLTPATSSWRPTTRWPFCRPALTSQKTRLRRRWVYRWLSAGSWHDFVTTAFSPWPRPIAVSARFWMSSTHVPSSNCQATDARRSRLWTNRLCGLYRSNTPTRSLRSVSAGSTSTTTLSSTDTTTRYPAQRLNASCRLANREGLTHLKQTKAILQVNRDKLPEQLPLGTELPQHHENIRGPNSFL